MRERRSNQEAVEVVAELLCDHQTLTSAGGAALEIVFRRRLAVIDVREAQRPLILQAKAFAVEVFDLADVELVGGLNHPERGIERVAALVSGVGKGSDGSLGNRGQDRCGRDAALKTAAPEIADAPVPGALAIGAAARP